MALSTTQNPIDRITELTNNDLDYADLKAEFLNLIELAKNITGLEVGLLNLIDAHNLWPISQSGIAVEVMALQDTPCQFTILKENYFEIKDLTTHDVLKHKNYVKGAPFYKYYLGVPLKTQNGINIGSLCFFDTNSYDLDQNKIKLLSLIAKEASFKIESIKKQNDLREEFSEFRANQRIIANNLRNPLAGIIGLSDILVDEDEITEETELREYNLLINKSSKSILNIFDDIIINQKKQKPDNNTINLNSLRERLINLYSPLCVSKHITLDINVNQLKTNILFLKSNVNYLIGSLLVEAVIQVADKGILTINLDLIIKVDQLCIRAEFSSNNLLTTPHLTNSEVLNVYNNKIGELGGELILNPNTTNLYHLTLPLKTV